MGCFIVPAAEAIGALVAKKVVKGKNKKKNEEANEKEAKFSLEKKLGLLSKMLGTGSILLMFEHIWHGEVVPYFPFLTAASNSEDLITMLKEMSTVGVSMALLVTFVWGFICLIIDLKLKRKVVLEK